MVLAEPVSLREPSDVTESHDFAARRSRQGGGGVGSRSGMNNTHGPCRLFMGARARGSGRLPPGIPPPSACRGSGPAGQVGRQVGPDAAGPYRARCHALAPPEPAGGQADKRHRIGLDDIGWRAPRVPWPFDALNRAVRRNPHLHRTARCPGPQGCEQRPDSDPQVGRVWPGSCVDRLTHGGHCVRIGTTHGHARTIRFDRRARTAAPGSRKRLWTRHSCLRCSLRSVAGVAGLWKGRGREYAPTCVDWCHV